MYRWLRHAGSIPWKRHPIQLTFFVTRKCNARCPFCFYLQGAEAVQPGPAELSLEEIGKVSGSLGPLLWLAFSGGEIFLRKDLVEISQVFYRQNRPVIMLYPTNGLLPELIYDAMLQILRHCPDSIVVVKISLDGVAGAHDDLRHTPGGFDKAMQTYHRLAGLLDEYPNFEIGINTVFCAGNQDSMDGIIEFVRGLKHVRTHTLSLVRGQLTDPSYQAVDYAKYERAVAKLAANLRSRAAPIYRFRGGRLKAAQDILQRRLIQRTAREQRALTPCYAGKLNLVLTENGAVYPCELLTTSLGNVREYDYDVSKILRSGKSGTAVRAIREQRCFCTHECYFITNILFNPRWYLALAREYLRL